MKTSATLGAYLVGPNGMTLYIRLTDGPNASSCVDTCATTWPPFTVSTGNPPPAGAGVTGTLATFVRADGATQASYDNRALYYYSGDVAAGDTNGQGLNNVWFVALVAGNPAPSSTP